MIRSGTWQAELGPLGRPREEQGWSRVTYQDHAVDHPFSPGVVFTVSARTEQVLDEVTREQVYSASCVDMETVYMGAQDLHGRRPVAIDRNMVTEEVWPVAFRREEAAQSRAQAMALRRIAWLYTNAVERGARLGENPSDLLGELRRLEGKTHEAHESEDLLLEALMLARRALNFAARGHDIDININVATRALSTSYNMMDGKFKLMKLVRGIERVSYDDAIASETRKNYAIAGKEFWSISDITRSVANGVIMSHPPHIMMAMYGSGIIDRQLIPRFIYEPSSRWASEAVRYITRESERVLQTIVHEED